MPPDPVKAYKWSILATAPNSEWGDLAADLRSLLKERISVAEQAEGTRQAEAWEEDRKPKPQEAFNRPPPPNLGGAADATALLKRAGAFEGLDARLAGGAAVLREGDPISVEIKARDYPVNIRVDYFSLDGKVLHMLPNAELPAITLAAGNRQVFTKCCTGGAPFGTELISVIATPQTLDLGRRPETEEAADYLGALEGALRRTRPNSQQPNLFATIPVQTAAR